VWAFGCVIANVVTGRSPFSEDKSEQALLVSLRQKKPVYKRAHVRPGCPEKVLEIIDRCTQYDPTLRPTMTEVGEELRGVLQSIQSQDGFGLPALWQERGCLLDCEAQLVECRQGSRDYDLIKTRMEEEMRDKMGTLPTVLKVEMNANVDLLRRYDLEKKKVSRENDGDANELWLWHATRSDAAEQSILKNGFDLNRCGGSDSEPN
jgi:serine/threonine protein kinase